MSIRISAIILLIKDVTQWLLNECQQFNYSTDILEWARQGYIRVGNVFPVALQLSVLCLYEEFLLCLCLCLRLLDIVRILKFEHFIQLPKYIYNVSTYIYKMCLMWVLRCVIWAVLGRAELVDSDQWAEWSQQACNAATISHSPATHCQINYLKHNKT